MDKQREGDSVVEKNGLIFLFSPIIDHRRSYIVDYYDIIWAKRGFRVYDI